METIIFLKNYFGRLKNIPIFKRVNMCNLLFSRTKIGTVTRDYLMGHCKWGSVKPSGHDIRPIKPGVELGEIPNIYRDFGEVGELLPASRRRCCGRRWKERGSHCSISPSSLLYEVTQRSSERDAYRR